MTLCPLIAAYDEQCQQGDLTWDERQHTLLEGLAPLFQQLTQPKGPKQWLKRLLSLQEKDVAQGAYLYGQAGRGKTALMDLFYTTVPVSKKRFHFHEFMQAIHSARHKHQHQPDPLEQATQEVCGSIQLLCLDEMEVKDIADALILGKTLEHIISRNIMFLTTSNRPMDDLYLEGLHRDRFLPTIALMKTWLHPLSLDSPIDYRLQCHAHAPHTFWPLTPETAAQFQRLFQELTQGAHCTPYTATAWDRTLTFPHHAKGVLKTTFAQLCHSALATGDYLAICNPLKILLLDELPPLTTLSRDELRRFILLIDVLYDKQKKLYLRAAAPISPLYDEDRHWAFEFKRTYSRLMEMQSW